MLRANEPTHVAICPPAVQGVDFLFSLVHALAWALLLPVERESGVLFQPLYFMPLLYSLFGVFSSAAQGLARLILFGFCIDKCFAGGFFVASHY